MSLGMLAPRVGYTALTLLTFCSVFVWFSRLSIYATTTPPLTSLIPRRLLLTASTVRKRRRRLKFKMTPSTVAGGCDGGATSYRVTGVLADGRCLFRAIAHGECLQSGKEAPDENRQRELADELRAQVVDELLKRRKEVAAFIEEDFDAYVKRIQQPYVWGGEPELLMASHVLKKPISVFSKDRTTGDMTKTSVYGEEYKNENEPPILVLFHGYGHYDLLETPSC